MIDEAKIATPVAPTTPPGGAGSTEKVGVRKRVRVRRTTVGREREKWLQPLPLWVWLVTLAFALLGAFSVNPLLTPFCILMLPVLASLLWIRGEPPVLLFVCGLQWLTSSTAVFYTNFYRLSMREISGGPELFQASWLSSIGVLVMAIGMRVALVRRKGDIAGQVEQETRQLAPLKIFVWYLIAFAVAYVMSKLASLIPTLRQPLQTIGTLRWVMVFLVAYSVITQRRHYGLLYMVLIIEFFTGILGYFAGFKSVFLILLIVLSTARFLFNGWKLVQLIGVAVVVLAFCIVWMVIKGDYREFLNQGSGMQEVVVSVPERLDKLEELVGGLDRRSVEEGMENLILRVSYVQYFALSIMNVPANLPHEHGALWLGAIKHVLMPRFLFPNKPVVNDTEQTAHYTGVAVAGEEQGTSICIGYIGESYIDFGQVGMFVPLLLLGLFFGFIYRYFVDRYHVKVIGFALAVAILAFGVDGGSIIKVVGGNLMVFLAVALFAKVSQGWFWGLISLTDESRPTRRRKAPKAEIIQPNAA